MFTPDPASLLVLAVASAPPNPNALPEKVCTVLFKVEPITSYATTPPCVVNLTLLESTSNALLPFNANETKSICPFASVFTILFASLVFVTLENPYVPAPVLINASPGSAACETSTPKSPSTIPPPSVTTELKDTAVASPVPAVVLPITWN